jgi:hypothetical protein
MEPGAEAVSTEKSEDESGTPVCETTVLFGAGASADAGILLGSALDTEIRSRIVAQRPAATVEAWDFLLEKGGNFEEVYRLARQLVHLHRFELLDGSPAVAHVAGARDLAGHEWDQDRDEDPGSLAPIAAAILGHPASLPTSYLDPLGALATRQAGLTVSTLNYDSVLPDWAATQGEGFLQVDDPEDWRPGDPWPARTAPLQVLNLHGSAAWQWKSRAPIGDRSFLLPVVHLADPRLGNGDPAIILGAGNKLRAGGPFLALLDAFSAALAAADHLVIVGYSFTDTHINARIADWFDQDPAHRFITVVTLDWVTDDGLGFYPTRFAERADRRLRVLDVGLQINQTVVSSGSPPRLRVIIDYARNSLKRALACPTLGSTVGPTMTLRQVESGRAGVSLDNMLDLLLGGKATGPESNGT